MGGKISGVLPDSIAEELGIEAGDWLVSINDRPVRDVIDYNYWLDEDYLQLVVEKPDGEIWDCEVEKYPDEDLGLVFENAVFDQIRGCRNHCLFCFVDQLHPKPRPTLLLKDDDFRMSFLLGNYITCTNMSDADYQRIAEQRLSPLYISVHSVDPELRQRLLGTKGPAEILLTLQRLIALGCRLHTQIVLCPGINDGPALERTLDALTALWPGVASVAVVPVGITKFQKHPELRQFAPLEAAGIIDTIERRQEAFRALDQDPLAGSFVYAADEFYIRAGRPFPLPERYGDFCQIDNGVGMAARFGQEYAEALRDFKIPREWEHEKIGIVTGLAGALALVPVISDLQQRCRCQITLLSVANTFFGETVTVSGLLTGACLLAAIPKGRYDRLLIPGTMLKAGQEIFLDDLTLAQVSQALQTPLQPVEVNGLELLRALFSPQFRQVSPL